MQKFTNLILAVVLAAGSLPAMADSGRYGNAPRRLQADAIATTMKPEQSSVRVKTRPRVNFITSATQLSHPLRQSQPSAPARVQGTNVSELQGVIAYSGAYRWPGVYTIPTTGDGEFSQISVYYDLEAPQMAVVVDGVRYIHDLYYNFYDCIYGFDLETDEIVLYQDVSTPELCGNDLALDPTTGNVYAIAFNSNADGCNLSIFHYSPQEVTNEVVGPCRMFYALACDAAGQLYAIDSAGDLYSVDKLTAESTLIGSTGFEPKYISSATIDTDTGRMLWNVCPADFSSKMVEVDLTTGAGTLLCEFPDGDEIVGLEFFKKFIPATPAAATDLSLNFIGASLTGTVAFEAPEANLDGSAASGNITYVIAADDAQLATGTTQYGAHVERQVNLGAAGNYTFTVVCSNDEGDGPKAATVHYVGSDTPKAPADVAAVLDAGTVTLTWQPVTEGVHGGWVDPEEVTYNIELNGQSVATGVTGTTWSQTVESEGALSSNIYCVYACFDGLTSAGSNSNAVTFGSIELPWLKVFDQDATLDEFVIIDANDDGKPWMMSHEGATYYARVFYNKTLPMDDWLICPPMALQSDKMYELTFRASGRNGFPEIIEVKYGTAATVEAMTKVAVEPTTVKDVVTVTTFVQPETDGTYYFGFHGISEPDQYELRLFDISISAAKDVTTPMCVSSLSAVPAEAFSRTINLSLEAPLVTVGETELTAIERIELSRGETVVHTFENPQPGQALSCQDTVDEFGDYTYTAVVYANGAASSPVSTSLYVGPTVPGAVEALTLDEYEQGKVRITWSEPTLDSDERPIPSGVFTYVVVDGDGKEIARTTQTSCELTVTATDEQCFANYGVAAITEAGTGNITFAEVLPVGKAYTDFAESFAGATTHYIWAQGYETEDAAWNLATDATISDVSSADHDNGLIFMQATSVNATGALASGKIKVDTTNPALVFYIYNIVFESGTRDTNIVNVDVRQGGGQWQNVCSETVDDLGNGIEGWAKVIVPLDEYAGKDIQFKIQPVVKVAQLTIFDAFAVTSLKDRDMAVTAISAPSHAVPGESFEVTVTVENAGRLAMSNCSVELYINDKKVSTLTGQNLEPKESRTFTLEPVMSAIITEPARVYALVNAQGDENEANNKSEVITVAPIRSNLPCVTDLSGALTHGVADLGWSTPDLTDYYDAATEEFEDGEAFAFTYDGWTFVDVDGTPVGGINNLPFPNITPGTTRCAFFVFDTEAIGAENIPGFAVHSGKSCLAAMYASNFTATDDWAISPELSGNAQTIEFYARSYAGSYPEKIEVLWSDGSTNPDDFESLGVVERVPQDWTHYIYDLPEGARHFAIRSFATDAFMLMIDDVKFEDNVPCTDLEVTGYHVYADYEKVTAAPVADTAYALPSYPGCDVFVTAVYKNRGESGPSNRLILAEASLDDLASAGITISTEGTTIFVSGAQGLPLSISATDGRVVYSTASAAATEKIGVSTMGVYLIKAGARIAKILVR